MRKLKFSALQWIVGAFCFIIGAMMLVIPHQFNSPSYAWLRPQIAEWGLLFLLAGAFLLIVEAFRLRRAWIAAGDVVGGGLLILLALGFASIQGWGGLIVYGTLGAGTLLAPFLAKDAARSESAGRGDFFALLMGISAALAGALMLIAPDQFRTSLFGQARDTLPWYGVGWLVGGLMLIAALLYARTLRLVYVVAHAFLGCLFLLWMLNVALPLRAWTGVLFYGGLGLLLAALPLLQWRALHIDPSSLRTRFTVTLIVVVATPLLLQSALVTDQEAQVAIAQSLSLQQRISGELARHISDYVTLYRSALDLFAEEPGLLNLSTSEQLLKIHRFQDSYPDARLLTLYDASGNPLVRSDGAAALPIGDRPMFQEVHANNDRAVQVSMGRTTQQPWFIFGAAIHNPDGSFGGLVALAIETSRVSDVLQQSRISPGDLIYMVDAQGHAIAHPDPAIADSFADLSQLPPVAAWMKTEADTGSIRYGAPGSERLVGYSQVEGLGWGIIAERTEAVALAGTYAGREVAFAIFLALAVVASVVGWINATVLTIPIRAVVHAMNQFGAGNVGVPLPRSTITDLTALTGAFATLRETLTARTAQRDQAEMHLREQTEVVETINRLGALLTAELDSSKVIQAVTAAAADLTGARYAVFFANASEDVAPALQPIAMVGMPLDSVHTANPSDHRTTLLSPVLHGDSVLRLGNLRQHPLYGVTPPSLGLPSDHVPVTSCLIVPVMSRSGPVLGTLFLGHPDPDMFTELHERIIVGLAAQTSIAMENARLYAQVQSHARTLEQEVARQTSELRIALAQAQSADRAKSMMLSTVTHEMRTPLSSIIGFSGLILSREPTPEKRTDFLTAINSEARRLARLIDDFLDLQRIGAGREVFHFDRLDLDPLIQEIVNQHGFDEQSRHRVRLELAPVTPVYADRERIRQVVLNLLSNAVKYSPDGGDITLRLLQAEETIFAIQDTGLGIAAQDLDHLFERFHRGDVAEELRIRGTGLGLALSKEIILAHQGRIWAESQGPNQGATFYFALPDAETARRRIEEAGPVTPDGNDDAIISDIAR